MGWVCCSLFVGIESMGTTTCWPMHSGSRAALDVTVLNIEWSADVNLLDPVAPVDALGWHVVSQSCLLFER